MGIRVTMTINASVSLLYPVVNCFFMNQLKLDVAQKVVLWNPGRFPLTLGAIFFSWSSCWWKLFLKLMDATSTYAFRSEFAMGVCQGVAMDSLKFHPGPPCPTLPCPVGGPPLKRLSSSPLDTSSHTLMFRSEFTGAWNGNKTCAVTGKSRPDSKF
jgi:hypothetical protein